MVTLNEIFHSAKSRLSKVGIENAYFETKELFCKAFGKEPVYFDMNAQADEEKKRCFETLVKRRLRGEPLQYILGEWEFYSLPIRVGKGVLIPRQDTEMLVDTAVNLFKDRHGITVIDLCSGSGCIGLALEKNLDVDKLILVENSKDAIRYLKENVGLNNSKAVIIESSVLDVGVIDRLPQADLIVSNPPYLNTADMENLQREVEFEPKEALFGGEDGLDFYRNIARLYSGKLNAGGRLIFEIGINQGNMVMQILTDAGYENVKILKDLCGTDRVVLGEKSKQTDC